MKYTHLMLSGGALYGLIYIGIYRFLKEFKLFDDIRYIYGTSVGSLFGFLFGLNLDYEYMEQLFTTSNMYFNAPSVIQFHPSVLFNIYDTLGAYSGRQFVKPLETILENMYGSSDITFCEYVKRTGKDLHINATCINTGEIIDFCNENYPDMSVLTAIEASISIPLLFKPIMYKDLLFIDGGTSNNLPLHWIPTLNAHKTLAINMNVLLEYNTDILKNNFLKYLFNIIFTVLKAASLIEQKLFNNIDILDMNAHEIPILPINLKQIDDLYQLDYPKEVVEKAIIYGYEKIYFFYTSKYTS